MRTKRSSKELIISLVACRDRLIELHTVSNKPYLPIVEFLTEKDYYLEDDLPYPTVKEIQQYTELTYSKVRKYLEQIYYDSLNIHIPLRNKSVMLIAKGFDSSYAIEYTSIPHIPSVGEEVNLPFLRYELITTNFFVQKVSHEIVNGEQKTIVWLNHGQYNVFWAMKKAEGFFKGYLRWDDYFHKTDDEIKEKWKEWKW